MEAHLKDRQTNGQVSKWTSLHLYLLIFGRCLERSKVSALRDRVKLILSVFLFFKILYSASISFLIEKETFCKHVFYFKSLKKLFSK